MLEYWWAIALVAVVVVILLVRTGRASRDRGVGPTPIRAPTPSRKAAVAETPGTPSVASPVPSSYDEMLRSPDLRQAVSRAGWERPPAAHSATLAALASGGHVVLIAEPDAVRSAAYLLAALDRAPDVDGLSTLVLCSDRRHAARVAAEARELARDGDVWLGEIHEEGDEETQLRDLRAGFDIVVATPGRLNRHLRNGAPVMSDVKLIVVDDATEMLSRPDLARRFERVLGDAPAGAQMLLVAADANPRLREKAGSLAPDARWIEVEELPMTAAPASASEAQGAELAQASQSSADRVSGVVKWFNDSKGYGFLLPDGGDDDVFVHYSAIAGDGFRSLEEGGRVRFTIVDTQKGPEAADVEPL